MTWEDKIKRMAEVIKVLEHLGYTSYDIAYSTHILIDKDMIKDSDEVSDVVAAALKLIAEKKEKEKELKKGKK